ncbi:glycosyltransferase [Ideonella azotifigens]|uniref:Glycosyltransferase family 2 protein n=1 Tax=Ideonella azotifigens TaxID=513160 RepID=A0ABP3VCP6_9BURK|nr:glycosyltransferase [Ideonella azotifigens]MCD2341583.1 glycosyltransferase [Ideonella azotifigens]
MSSTLDLARTPPGQALLTIIVPTYNRAANLELLLRTLRQELATCADAVTVLVSDNASVDRTSEVVQAMQSSWPALVAQRHASNLGPDGNFSSCVERVSTRWFWIIGDDDLPKRGVIAQVVALLRERQPSLVYLQSEWLPQLTGPDQGEPVGCLRVETMHAEAFAHRVHIWFTFISGMVVDRNALMGVVGSSAITRFTATSLIQLGWILPLLRTEGRRFSFVADRCMLATKDNSGGYALLTVFGANFARIVNDCFGRDSRIARVLIRRNLLHFMPGILWGARKGVAGRHAAEDAWPAMRRELGDQPLFWLLLVPLGRFPGWLAQPFYQSWRVYHRLTLELDRLRLRAAGAKASR